MIRVYQFGLKPPTENADLVRREIRGAHEYRNVIVQIERGRRPAVRAIHDASSEVQEAADLLRAATRSTRRECLTALNAARRSAERDAVDEMDRIKGLENQIRKDAYNSAECFWGSRWTIAQSHDQVRKASLYADDGLTPSDPRFARWRGYGPAERQEWLGEGQIGVQLQLGRTTARMLSGEDSQVRVSLRRESAGRDGSIYGTLRMRVGSQGRDPIWAEWPLKVGRGRFTPDEAIWMGVRVSCRCEGTRELWTCEVTVRLPGAHHRTMDGSLSGAVAVELLWTPLDDGGMRIGRWLDSFGQRGEILLSAYHVNGIRKPDGIRAVRDLMLNRLREDLASAFDRCRPLPEWLSQEASTIHLWKSPERFRKLLFRWQRRGGAIEAYGVLDAWRIRDDHLYDYEACGRGTAIRARTDFYRTLAAQWARRYVDVLVPDRDLSREARWGDDSDRRFTASTSELRDCLRAAFGPHAHDVAWLGPHGVLDDDSEEGPPEWLEQAIERWRDGEMGGSARKRCKRSTDHQQKGGAWAARKERRRIRDQEKEAARKPTDKCAE